MSCVFLSTNQRLHGGHFFERKFLGCLLPVKINKSKKKKKKKLSCLLDLVEPCSERVYQLLFLIKELQYFGDHTTLRYGGVWIGTLEKEKRHKLRNYSREKLKK